MSSLPAFRERLGLTGGETNPDDGIVRAVQRALERARAAPGELDVRVSGGADVIGQ